MHICIHTHKEWSHKHARDALTLVGQPWKHLAFFWCWSHWIFFSSPGPRQPSPRKGGTPSRWPFGRVLVGWPFGRVLMNAQTSRAQACWDRLALPFGFSGKGKVPRRSSGSRARETSALMFTDLANDRDVCRRRCGRRDNKSSVAAPSALDRNRTAFSPG